MHKTGFSMAVGVKRLLLAFILMISAPVMAMSNPEERVVAGQTEQYARVVATGKLLSLTKWKVTVDFGQETKISLRNKDLLRDDHGNTIVFNSPIDALNFLNAKGWILVSASASPDSFSAIMKRSLD